jgi:ferritin-like metal-binding protein YciE
MATEKAVKVIQRYIEDAIAAEKGFEAQLRAFAEEGSSDQVHHLFLQHAEETRRQYERLTTRLHELGGEPSATKSLLAQLFVFTPKIAQIGHDIVDRVTQNLMVAYSVECFEVAMYEALIAVAEAAGDQETALLARDIQEEEREMAANVWRLIAPWAHTSFNKLAAMEPATV